jgi:hypothetical protein
VNLLKNDIPVEQAQELVKVMQSKEKLTTLCGLSRKETALDFSRQALGPGDAVLIANDISGMGALLHFDISNNDIRAQGGKALAEAFKGSQVITTLIIANNMLIYKSGAGRDMSGVAALADAIPSMGALTSLNLAHNDLYRWDMSGNNKVYSLVLPFVCYVIYVFDLFRRYRPCQRHPRYEGVDQARLQQKLHRSCAGGGAPAHLLGQRHRWTWLVAERGLAGDVVFPLRAPRAHLLQLDRYLKQIDGPLCTFATSQTHPPSDFFFLDFFFSTLLGISRQGEFKNTINNMPLKKKKKSKTFPKISTKISMLVFPGLFLFYRGFGCFLATGVQKHHKQRFAKKSCGKVFTKTNSTKNPKPTFSRFL